MTAPEVEQLLAAAEADMGPWATRLAHLLAELLTYGSDLAASDLHRGCDGIEMLLAHTDVQSAVVTLTRALALIVQEEELSDD